MFGRVLPLLFELDITVALTRTRRSAETGERCVSSKLFVLPRLSAIVQIIVRVCKRAEPGATWQLTVRGCLSYLGQMPCRIDTVIEKVQ